MGRVGSIRVGVGMVGLGLMLGIRLVDGRSEVRGWDGRVLRKWIEGMGLLRGILHGLNI